MARVKRRAAPKPQLQDALVALNKDADLRISASYPLGTDMPPVVTLRKGTTGIVHRKVAPGTHPCEQVLEVAFECELTISGQPRNLVYLEVSPDDIDVLPT